jgi:hypothetical protein
MFLLGICSIFQMIFLPGFLVIKPLNIQGKIRILIFSFALSLIINYCMVLLLVKLSLYIRAIVLIIFGIEMLILIIMIYPSLNQTIFSVNINSMLFMSYLRKTINEIKHNPYSLIPFMLRFTIMALAAVTILWYTKQLFTNIGQVFSSWDGVVSFNPFAVTWSESKLPDGDWWRYGQLITANWSLTYVFTHSKVEFFAKSIMALFPMHILLLMLDLALRRKSIGHYIGIIATGILFNIFPGDYIEYADIPVSFFIYLSIYSLVVSYYATDFSIKKKILLMGVIFSFGAMAIKFAGQLIAFLYPLLAFFIILKNIKSVKLSEKFKFIIPIFVALIIIAIFFVVYPQNIYREIEFVKHRIGELRSAKEVFQVITTKIPMIYLFLFILFSLFFSFFDRIYGLIMLSLTCPLVCAWVFFDRSNDIYDLRYLVPAIPLIGLSVGKGIENMASLAQRVWQKFTKSNVINMQAATENNDTVLYNNTPQQQPLFRIKLFELLIFLAFFLIIPSFLYTRSYLTERQIFMQQQIGYREINKVVYDYQRDEGLSGKIISNYQYLGHLPGLEKFYGFIVFKSYEDYDYQRKDPNVHYFLIMTAPGWGINQEIVNDINNRVKTGEYQLISSEDNILFVSIR